MSNFRFFKSFFLSSLFIFILNFNLFCNKNISEKAENYIDSFMNFRVELTQFKDKSFAAEELEKYRIQNAYTDFSEQEKLIIDSFYLLEKYNYIWENKENDKYLQNALLSQMDENFKFISENKGNVNEWLYVITADTISCYMSYSPVSGAIKYGTKVKEFYEECLKLDAENSYCLTHIGQWYFWAPGIAGGSGKKALYYFEKGLNAAKNNAEKFYALIFLSQFLYENKDKSDAQNYLDSAKALFPKSVYLNEIQEYNNKGYSLFSYSKKKAKDENRVEKSY